MKNIFLKKVENLNERISLHFKIDSYLLERQCELEDNKKDLILNEKEAQLFKETYGFQENNLGEIELEVFKNKSQTISNSLIEEENKIYKEFYFLTYQDINEMNKKETLDVNDLNKIVENNLESRSHNLSSYFCDYMYLFAAKNSKDVEDIFSVLELRKRYTHSDDLFVSLISHKETDFLFKNETPKLIDDYLKSNCGLTSTDKLLKMMNKVINHNKFANNKDQIGVFLDKINNIITNDPKFLNIKTNEAVKDKPINEKEVIRDIIDGIKDFEEEIKSSKDPAINFYNNENLKKIKEILNKTMKHIKDEKLDFYSFKELESTLNKQENKNKLKI